MKSIRCEESCILVELKAMKKSFGLNPTSEYKFFLDNGNARPYVPTI